mmetsp:Transcript_10677/g.31585  ORF Transcript_10677/g.31585 Transcript_10677/m.31585 type:complete len:83 (+) Transcript_10677:78-326(+)
MAIETNARARAVVNGTLALFTLLLEESLLSRPLPLRVAGTGGGGPEGPAEGATGPDDDDAFIVVRRLSMPRQGMSVRYFDED